MVLMMNPLVWLVSSDDDGPYDESYCLSVSLPPSLFSPLSPESKREGRRKRYNYIEKKRDNLIVEASSGGSRGGQGGQCPPKNFSDEV